MRVKRSETCKVRHPNKLCLKTNKSVTNTYSSSEFVTIRSGVSIETFVNLRSVMLGPNGYLHNDAIDPMKSNGPWSIGIIFIWDGTIGTIWSMSSGTGNNDYNISIRAKNNRSLSFKYGTNQTFFKIESTLNAIWPNLTYNLFVSFNGAASPTAADFQIFKINNQGQLNNLINSDNGVSVSSFSSPTSKLYIGSNSGDSDFMNGTTFLQCSIANQVLSNSEIVDFVQEPVAWASNTTATTNDPSQTFIWLMGNGSNDNDQYVYNQVDVNDDQSKLTLANANII